MNEVISEADLFIYLFGKTEIGILIFLKNAFCSQQEKMLKEENQQLQKQVVYNPETHSCIQVAYFH